MKHLRIVIFGLLLGCAWAGQAAAQATGKGNIKYISIEGVYIDVGKNVGLAIGDSIIATRNNKALALLQVTHVSSRSAACRILKKLRQIRVGDTVVFIRRKRFRMRNGMTHRGRAKKLASRRSRSTTSQRKRNRRKQPSTELTGYVSFQSYVQQNWLDTRRTLFQPSVDSRIKVRNLVGTGLTFIFRHRSRFHHRSNLSSTDIPNSEWTHRLFEMGILLDNPNSPLQFGVGRVYSPYIRGIGTIDGGHVAYRILPHFLVGTAFGAEPQLYNTDVEFTRKKVGFFITYESSSEASLAHHLSTTLAMSGSYRNDVVNREFLYWQTQFSFRNLLSIYQTLEIDINRGWRKLSGLSDISFSNFFLTGNLFLHKRIQFNFSFDARRNLPTYEMHLNTADSLFDVSLHRGASAGLSLYLPLNMTLRGNVSLRFRQDNLQDNLFASIFYNIRHFPKRGHHFTARLAYIRVPFTRAYRPVFTYRFPFRRRYIVNLTAGGYLYKNRAFATSTYFGEISTFFNFARDYFASASLRQYYEENGLGSFQLYWEIGRNF